MKLPGKHYQKTDQKQLIIYFGEPILTLMKYKDRNYQKVYYTGWPPPPKKKNKKKKTKTEPINFFITSTKWSKIILILYTRTSGYVGEYYGPNFSCKESTSYPAEKKRLELNLWSSINLQGSSCIHWRICKY